jgi:rhamnulokinase
LAVLYSHTLREIGAVTGRKVEYLHVVGGGSKNRLLNQLTADATQLTVLAGPPEATAIGNILVQAIALDHLD